MFKRWLCGSRLNFNSIVLDFLHPSSKLSRTDVTTFCIQLRNWLMRYRHWGESRVLPWYKGEGRDMGNTAVTSVLLSWELGFKNPKLYYYLVDHLFNLVQRIHVSFVVVIALPIKVSIKWNSMRLTETLTKQKDNVHKLMKCCIQFSIFYFSIKAFLSAVMWWNSGVI